MSHDHEVAHAVLEDDLRARQPGRAGADDHHADVVGVLAHDAQRVQQRRQHDHRGAVLVVVEDRDVERLLQPPLDLEAARRRDVLEVDAAERRRDPFDDAHDLVDVGGAQAQREGVDAGELLEQHRLALHHRHRRLGPDVPEPEHRAAVGHDRDGVALDRQRPGRLGVLVDRRGHARDARRIGHREVVAGLDRDLADDLDLAALVHQERAVGDAGDRDALERPHRVDDALAVGGVDARHGDVARDAALVDADEVDRAEDRALGADRARHRGERARQLAQLDAHGEGVGGRGLEPRRRLQAGHAPDGVTGARSSAPGPTVGG